MITVELKEKVDKKAVCGDFLVLENGEIRQVCEDYDKGFFAIDLSGEVQSFFYESIEGVMEFYRGFNDVKRIIKSDNMKLVEG